MDDIYVRLGAYMRKFRENAGLTQQEAADKLGICRSTLTHYEAGRRKPTLDFLFQLEMIYKADMITAILEAKKTTDK